MTSFFEMKISASLYGSGGSILEKVIVTGLGQETPRGRPTLFGKTSKTPEVSMSEIGEQAMKEALQKAFGQLVSSPAVHRYEEQIKTEQFLKRIGQF